MAVSMLNAIDTSITPTAGDSPRSNIYAKVNEDGGYTVQFCDGNGRLFVLAEGSVIEVGTVTKNGVKLSKDAQNTLQATQAKINIPWGK
jgi:hypothetical protein